ncbi:MAG: J domain-containing protein [Pseudomonadota bacterium]
MLKIALILGAISILFRMAIGKWPWQMLNPAPTRSQALFKARKLLGVEERATRAEIVAAHRRLVAMVHPDRGGTNASVHEANDARDLLLNELPDKGAALGQTRDNDDA